MKIPQTVADHLRRAEVVYGDRVAIVGETDQVAQALTDLTYARTDELARAMAAGLDARQVGKTFRSEWIELDEVDRLAYFGIRFCDRFSGFGEGDADQVSACVTDGVRH